MEQYWRAREVDYRAVHERIRSIFAEQGCTQLAGRLYAGEQYETGLDQFGDYPVVANIEGLDEKGLLKLVVPNDLKGLYNNEIAEMMPKIFEPFEFNAYSKHITPSFAAFSGFIRRKEPRWVCLVVRFLKFSSPDQAILFVDEIRNYMWSTLGREDKVRDLLVRAFPKASTLDIDRMMSYQGELLKLDRISQFVEDRNILGIPVLVLKTPKWRSQRKFEYFMYWCYENKVMSLNATEDKAGRFECGNKVLERHVKWTSR